MTTQTLPATEAAAIRPNAAVAAWRILKGLTRNLMRRRAVIGLGELSDHELADIGLIRSDLSGALGGSLMEDPTQYLARAARRPKPVQSAWY